MSGLCGIVDFAAFRIETEALLSMAESAPHRAPAGTGCRFLGEAGLAHLAHRADTPGRAGAAGLSQPLLDPLHQICLVLDGRLDNRSELIARLEPAAGAAASDAELLLAAYHEWEEACTDHLLGDFAFAVWDAGRHRLLCAVDPLGLKPFHYARAGSLLCFASDAVQVLRHPAVPGGFNEREIAAYLANQIEDPEQSFFAAVRKLAPGHRLAATAAGVRVERYWRPDPAEIRYARDDDYAAHFREVFARAVADRLRDAASGVGIAMSGGLDSTSVAALAQRVPGCRARAYSFTFDRLGACDERRFSRAMTDELDLEVEPLDTERLWSLESQGTVPVSPDTPFIGWRTCYEEIFRRMAAGGSRVLLTGHGGDDLFRGSATIYAERLRRGDLGAFREVVRHARRWREPLLRTFYRYFGRPHLPARADRLLSSAFGRRREPLLAPWVRADFARRADLAGRSEAAAPAYWRFANWHERSAAGPGIEVRHPFLDRRLFELVLAIPGEQVFRLDTCKSLLRRSMAGILPETIRLREGKTEFTPLLDFGLRERARDEIHELLREPRSADLGILDGGALRAAYAGFLDGGSHDLRRALWYAITLEIWLRRCESIRGRRPEALTKRAAA
jgi:asparagine synthase (glutamine-hydrolysing)